MLVTKQNQQNKTLKQSKTLDWSEKLKQGKKLERSETLEEIYLNLKKKSKACFSVIWMWFNWIDS